MQEVVTKLVQRNDTKLVLCVLDGLGGLPQEGMTELEAADTPNLDALAAKSATGLQHPVAMGITPGSGSAHLGLFGYDPLTHGIGRGVLEALGLGIEIQKNDMALRGNFCTVQFMHDVPTITDRRAGRISTGENNRITALIRDKIKKIGNVRVNIVSGVEHRFVLVLSFPGTLGPGADSITDTDPQIVGEMPLSPRAQKSTAHTAAKVIDRFIDLTTDIIKGEPMANYILLRGASVHPDLDTFERTYGVRAAAIAAYPMYRGVSRLVGMDVIDVEGTSVEAEVAALEQNIKKYDFFYLHVKKTDSYGEDGDFEGKAGVIEEFDALLPRILSLEPDVLVVTGDHSTPSVMRSHSWHPVPFLLASKHVMGGMGGGFSERGCVTGELGQFRSVETMTLMLAHSERLAKFGA